MADGWITLVALVAMTLLLAGCPERDAQARRQQVTLGGESFTLELALDPDSRYQGLSDRPAIAEDGGMLFVFPRPADQCFVMRRCLVPIDLVFVGPSGFIVALHEMQTEPYDTPEWRLRRYCSGWAAQFAIELKAGSIQRLKLQTGQRLQMPLEELKQQAR